MSSRSRGDDYGGTERTIVMRGVSTVKGVTCPVQFYLDGAPVGTGISVDRLISPHEVAAVEVYSAGGYVPPQFSGPTARCGVIVLWSRAR